MPQLSKNPSSSQYRLVRLFYEVAFLDGRRRAGMDLSPEEEDRLHVLLSLLAGDPSWTRRRFQRKEMMLSVIVKGPGGVARATIVNMSPDGMLLLTDLDAELDEAVLVKVGVPGTTQHSLPCKVVRVEDGQIAVALNGIPLEVRYGSYQARNERRRQFAPQGARIRTSA